MLGSLFCVNNVSLLVGIPPQGVTSKSVCPLTCVEKFHHQGVQVGHVEGWPTLMCTFWVIVGGGPACSSLLPG